jgi:PRTRC genetic system protein B
MIEMPVEPKFTYQAALYFLQDAGHYLFTSYEGKRKSSKFVTQADVAAAFAGQEQDTGWLTPGILRSGHNAGGDWYAYSAPAQKVQIELVDYPEMGTSKTITLHIPRTLLLARQSGYALFAMRNERFERDAPVYHAPFPNVHDAGKICWGTNAAPKVEAGKARQAWELFFNSPFNGHLANGKSTAYPKDVREQLAQLDGKKKNYPCADLVAFGRRNVGQLIEDWIGD